MSSGYRLSHLRAALHPWRLYWAPRLDSTNNRVIGLIRVGALVAPAVVLTGRQTAGRGRGNNRWWSDAGSITVSVVVPKRPRLAVEQLPLVAGAAVRAAASEMTGNDGFVIKWPNDLLHDGRKVAGILCERIGGLDVIGIGLNVNTDLSAAPPALRSRLTSLARIAGRPVDKTQTLIALCRQLRRLPRGERH